MAATPLNPGHPLDALLAYWEPAFEGLSTDTADRPGTLDDAAAFARLPTVERLLAQLQPDGEPWDPATQGEWLALLFACYRFWAEGRRVLQPADAALAARLRDPAPPAGGLPETACYVRLPVRRLWAQARPEGPHEPIDGVFVVPSRRGGGATIVAVLGTHRDRAGCTLVSATAEPADFLAAFGAGRSDPFAPAMEGGAAAGFHSVTTTAELLVLVQLAIAATAA